MPSGRVAFLLAMVLLSPRALSAGATGLADCEKDFADHPEGEKGPKCFADLAAAASGGKPADAARRRLEDLQAQHPGLPWLSFYLGRVQWQSNPAALFRRAAGEFAQRGDAGGEFRARSVLFDLMDNREEAAFEVERAARAARASRKPQLIAAARVLEAKSLLAQGQHLERAYALLDDARAVVLGGSDLRLQADWLAIFGDVNFQLGRLDEAREQYRRLVELSPRLDPSYSSAMAPQIRYRLVRILAEKAGELPAEVRREEITAETRKALDAYERAGLPAPQPHLILGLLTEGEESDRHFDSCLAQSRSAADRCLCLSGRARRLAERRPREAQELILGALAAERRVQDPWVSTLFWGDRMRVSWRSQELPRAVQDSWEALDTVEELRQTQDPASRAGLFSIWSDVYYGFSGRLLEQPGRSFDGVAQAFAVIERLRGRTLLDKLAGVRPEPPSRERLDQRLQAVGAAIQDVEPRISDATLPRSEQENAQQDLKRLEAERTAIEKQLRSAGSPRAGGPSEFATLPEVQSLLDPHEALLSFQVAPWKDWTGAFGGGSWLTVVTRTGVRIYPLPGREDLRHRVSPLVSPLEEYKESPAESGYLVDLYEKLLAPAIKDLPPAVRRLVILPDDDLHKLPFAALHPAGARPLIERYQLTVAPSATLWRDWRQSRPRPARIPALVLADPVGLGELPPLPETAEEGREAVDALGGGSVLRTREEASEGFLKKADLRPYGILLLATHAVLEDNPERSSIRLTPSAGGKGHLEVAQILELKMGGKVVVLSTCESAAGQILRGEGVMSLARAFFAAGAHTVVGSLWPVEEHDGERLLRSFYGHLGQGASVAAALRAAQRDRIADGAPLAAWAGFVVLGDGDLVPLPGGRRRSPVLVWASVLAAALLGFPFAWRAWRRYAALPRR